MEERLFSDFEPVTRRQWIDRMLQDLKGLPYEKLVWQSPEGIPVEPAYTRENTEEPVRPLSPPGVFPYLRGYRPGRPWVIGQDITVSDPKKANKHALRALKGGAEALGFIYPDLPEPCIGMDGLLNNIDLAAVPVFLETNLHPYTLFTGLKKAVAASGVAGESFHGAISFDPLGFLMVHGDYPSTEKDTFFWGKEVMEEAGKRFPHLHALAIHADILNHAGGTAAQEIGYALAMGNEYLSYYTDTGLTPEEIIKNQIFLFAVSENFFMETAKFRAFRMLWSAVVKAWLPGQPEIPHTHIHATTALRNKTLYDPYVNILRATTESMSAILGGVNSLTVRSHDGLLREYNETSAHLARNIQLILKHESRFGEITDAVAGAYYIETLTRQLADKAWEIFRAVEKEGGYRKALQKGIIQNALASSLNRRLKNIATRKEILTGTNHYPDLQESITADKSLDHLKMAWSPSTKRIRPVDIRRLSEEMESLRLTTELSQKKPVVYLFGFGAPAVRSARETFVINLVGCAGFAFAETNPGTTPGEHIREINRSKPDFVILCGDDDKYPEMIKKLKKEVKYGPVLGLAGTPEVLAGTPEEKEIRFFLYHGVDLPGLIRDLQKAVNLT